MSTAATTGAGREVRLAASPAEAEGSLAASVCVRALPPARCLDSSQILGRITRHRAANHLVVRLITLNRVAPLLLVK